MISLKYNSKKELMEAPGKRKIANSMYNPGQSSDFKISRSKFEDYLKCKACFYLDRVKGLIQPGVPGWTLNSLTDTMLKTEFDDCRKRQQPHPILVENGLSYIIPFDHPEIEAWRDSYKRGLQARFPNSNINLGGGLDDCWINTLTDQLVVVDYKSTHKKDGINPATYFADPYHKSYKTQLEFYSYLLDLMGFPVSNMGYLVVVNGINDPQGFHGRMDFEQTLVPCQLDYSWISEAIRGMIDVLNSTEIPSSNFACENCSYDVQRGLIA
tara:strand:+ start:2613 stop:3419 length:807 start_codon:yes stop_codon:yes gene_type:complete